jgi:hypothetical protein
MVSGDDEHPGTDQLIADMCGRPRILRPGSDASSFGKDVVAAVSYLAQLFDGFVEVAALGCIPHRGAVERYREQLVFGGHASLYRTQIRLR